MHILEKGEEVGGENKEANIYTSHWICEELLHSKELSLVREL